MSTDPHAPRTRRTLWTLPRHARRARRRRHLLRAARILELALRLALQILELWPH